MDALQRMNIRFYNSRIVAVITSFDDDGYWPVEYVRRSGKGTYEAVVTKHFVPSEDALLEDLIIANEVVLGEWDAAEEAMKAIWHNQAER